jgi:hypothetical protein
MKNPLDSTTYPVFSEPSKSMDKSLDRFEFLSYNQDTTGVTT